MYRILYVDDDPGLLEIGKLFLEEGGQFSVDISLSASNGLDLLASANYDAVISDYQMPGMDGIGFLKKVRTSGNTIPFILFTGRGREEVVIQALNEGADFYLQKGGEPVSQFTELSHKVRQSVQQRQAEKMIRDHERREADIINFLPDATFAIDIRGKVIAWNRAIEAMTGIPAGEMIGKANYEYALPFYHERRPITVDLVLHDDPAVVEKYPVMKKEGSSLVSEIYIPHLNKGRGAHLWFTASPLYDTAGNLTGAIESIRDITERKRTEETLILENQRIESLLSLSQMNTRTDSEITTQVVEDAIRLTGSTIGYLATLNDDESVMTMQHWSKSAHESCKIDNKPIVYAVEKTGLWGEAARQRKPIVTNNYAAESPFKRGTPKGHVPLVRHMNIPVFDGNHIVAIAGVGNKDAEYNEGDVHELQLLMQGWWQILVRKRAEEDIRRSNMILKTQLETSPDGILTVNEHRKILNYNQAFVAIWEIPIDLLASRINEPVLQHIAGQVANPDTFLTRVSSLYDHKKEKCFGDLLLKDGRILEWFSAPMLGEKEEYFGRIWFFRDITKRKMAEDAIRAAQEKFSTIYLQSPDIIWISELESGRFIDVNDAAERIFGYTREEFIGRSSLDLGIWVNPDDRAVLIQRIRREGRVDRSGIILRRKNRDIFNAECSASTILIHGTECLIITVRDISGMKQVEEALRESEERFRQLIETTSDWIWEADSTGKYTYISPKIRDLLGYEPDEVIGKTPFYLMPPEESEKVVSLFTGYLTAQKPFERLENINLHKDGRRIVLETSGIPFFDNKHTFLGYRGIDRDITERKRAEESVRKSFAILKGVVESPKDVIIFALDRQYRYTAFNENHRRTMKQIWGADIVLGNSMLDYIRSPEDRKKAVVNFDRALAGESFSVIEAYGDTAFERRWYEDIYNPVTDENGTVIGLTLFLTDITERKHAEEALKESEEKFREIFNNINDAIELHEVRDDGLPGKYLEVNDVTCRMLGYTREELLQHNPLDFSTDYHNRPIEEIGREILSNGHSRFETGHRNRNGGVIPVEINAHVLVLHGKTMALSVVRDITERKLAEDALREVNKKLNLLSIITRHDINNQLLTARGFLKVLHQKNPDPAYEKYFTRIEDSWGRISSIIQFTKQYEQIGMSAPVWQDCRILADTAVKDISPGNVLLKNDLPANTEVFADPLIGRVFYNLIDNAIRYGVKISQIHFFLQESADCCCIICEDDGVGVSAEEKERIFDRGFGKNTGMGLYLAREILSITKITITETGMPGKGARFEIKVPKGGYRNSGEKE
ncbi:MAG: PAS domain S-box protein [Methanoregula sp.]|jgi:PAS domain S-box-containing protein